MSSDNLIDLHESDWKRIWEIFHEARNLSDPLQREVYLNQIGNTEAELCVHVKELLDAEEQEGDFLQTLISDELNELEGTHQKENPAIEADDLLANRFRMIRQIGRGGMGTVYEAMDQELGIPVALKMMRQDHSIDRSSRDRFYREIQLARQITHPNACRIFDLFRDGDHLFLTMELLEGETLQERIKRSGRMSISEATPIFQQVATALANIHEAGIVHRDLKSSNIVLAKQHNGYRAVVTDFGLATSFAPSQTGGVTQTGIVLGTPEFMAPEQLTNGKITPATDVYALGLVLYQMIVGELPLGGESPLTIAARRLNEEAPSPRSLVPEIPRKWESIILRCLERNPKHRFQNASEVLRAIRSASAVQKIANAMPRRRTRLALAVALGIAALLASVWMMQSKVGVPKELEVKRILSGANGLPPGTLSTDGKILVDVDWQTADLLAIDLSSGRRRRITKNGTFFFPQKFSPYPLITSLSHDSTKVAYSLKREWDAGCDLRVVRLNGSSANTIYQNPNVCATPFDWTPDDERILTLVPQADGSAQIVLISLADRSLQHLASFESTDIRQMSFSPDGEYIAYDMPQERNSTRRDLFLLIPSKKQSVRLAHHQANEYFLAWTPEGKEILFASDRSGTQDAWSLPVRNGTVNGEPQRIRKDIGQIFPLKLTADGSLYYSHLLTTKDIYTVSLNSTATKAIGSPVRFSHGVSGSNHAPEFSPDGKTMIFQFATDPLVTSWHWNYKNILKIQSLDTNEIKDFAHQPPGASGKVRWSRDGNSILFTGVTSEGGGVHKLDVRNGESTKIVPIKNESIRQFEWGANGTAVYYLFNKEGVIWRKDLSSNKIRKICEGASDFALSPDDSWIAFTTIDIHQGSTSLRILPLKMGKPHEILKLTMPDWISNFTWAPDSRHIFLSRGKRDRIDDPHRLWKISMDGKKQYDLQAETEAVLDLRAHPDGKRLAVYTVFDSSEVWVMRNFLPNR